VNNTGSERGIGVQGGSLINVEVGYSAE